MLHEATTSLLQSDEKGPLVVSVLPSFGARWLVGRLGRFRAAHPEIDVHVLPSADLVDFARDNVDVGIRYGRGEYAGLRTDRLLTEDIFPGVQPHLARGRAPARSRRTTFAFTRFCTTMGMATGGPGCSRPASPTSTRARGTVYNDSGMLIQAAIGGQGVALARGALASDALQRRSSGKTLRAWLAIRVCLLPGLSRGARQSTKVSRVQGVGLGGRATLHIAAALDHLQMHAR